MSTSPPKQTLRAPARHSARHSALRPAGFAPLLGEAASTDRHLVNQLLDLWAAEGFTQVAPIQVDEAEAIFDQKSDSIAARSFRFTDPSDGRLLALLPDVTLGISRLVRGELAQAPRPLRLSYEGQAIRLRGSTSRPLRQFGQVGAEIIGADGTTAFSMIALALRALDSLAMASETYAALRPQNLSLCLALPPLAGQMIAELGLPSALATALDRKDEGKIRELAGDAAATFLAIAQGETSSGQAMEPLHVLSTEISKTFPDINQRVEPFEQRGFSFHTGPAFAIYAGGLEGEVARGGAYEIKGEPCFGFTLFRDALLTGLEA